MDLYAYEYDLIFNNNIEKKLECNKNEENNINKKYLFDLLKEKISKNFEIEKSNENLFSVEFLGIFQLDKISTLKKNLKKYSNERNIFAIENEANSKNLVNDKIKNRRINENYYDTQKNTNIINDDDDYYLEIFIRKIKLANGKIIHNIINVFFFFYKISSFSIFIYIFI